MFCEYVVEDPRRVATYKFASPDEFQVFLADVKKLMESLDRICWVLVSDETVTPSDAVLGILHWRTDVYYFIAVWGEDHVPPDVQTSFQELGDMLGRPPIVFSRGWD